MRENHATEPFERDELNDEVDSHEVQDGSDESVDCTPGWEQRCMDATSKVCGCACGGANHGKTLKARMASWRNNG